jgi:hypothetical protein
MDGVHFINVHPMVANWTRLSILSDCSFMRNAVRIVRQSLLAGLLWPVSFLVLLESVLVAVYHQDAIMKLQQDHPNHDIVLHYSGPVVGEEYCTPKQLEEEEKKEEKGE